ncbi:MAG: hypothetical protein ACYCY8_10860 [Burkholderiales bacterium]
MSIAEILERLLQKYCGQFHISVYEAAREIDSEWTPQAVRSMRHREKKEKRIIFPLPVHTVGRKKKCKLRDLATYLFDPTVDLFSREAEKKKGPGRPRGGEK